MMIPARREEAREALREILARMFTTPSTRERLLKTGISDSTFRRWASGESEPRFSNVQRILETCDPADQEALLPVVEQLWPDLFSLSRLDVPLGWVIPSAFYARVHVALAETPESLRYWAMCRLVLHQAVVHLDPERSGISISLVQCVPSAAEQKVRALREVVGLTSSVTIGESDVALKGTFLGAESLAGYAVSTFQLAVEQQPTGESAVAAPLLRGGRIGGCLLVERRQEPSFSPPVCTLIQQYAHLLTPALEVQDFFERNQIGLVLMPSQESQAPLLASWQQRKMRLMREQGLESSEAEQRVLQETVEELAALASS